MSDMAVPDRWHFGPMIPWRNGSAKPAPAVRHARPQQGSTIRTDTSIGNVGSVVRTGGAKGGDEPHLASRMPPDLNVS
jgi:hypothetical protein